MPDWMDEELAREKLAQENEAQAAQERQRTTALVKAKGRDVLNALTSAVADMVDSYQSKTVDDPRRRVDFNKNPSGGFSLDRSHYPAATLECQLDSPAGVIRCKRSYTPNRESTTQKGDFALDLTTNAKDEVVIEMNRSVATLAEVAEYLLRPVLFPPG